MRKIIAFLLACVLSAALFAGCGRSGQEAEESAEDYDTVATYEIQTAYAVLKYPERWEKTVETEISESDPAAVRFSANGDALFDLFFNADEGDVLGTLITDDGQYLMTVRMAELDQEGEHYQDYAAMQEDINVILANLKKDYQFVSGVDVREEETEVFEIQTPVVSLYYPVKWQEKVTVETTDNGAKFSCGGTPLFDIVFGDGDGVVVGTFDGKEVKIVDYSVDDPEMANMQEDVNVILSYLQQNDKYTPA